jgi:hypothetical protein
LLNNDTLEIQVMGGLGNQLHCLTAGLVISNHLGLKLSVNSERVKFGSNMYRNPEIESLIYPRLADEIRTKKSKNLRIKYLYEFARRNAKGVLPIIDIFSEPDYFDSGLSVNEQLASIPGNTRIVGGSFIDFEWVDRSVEFGFPTELTPKNPSAIYYEHLSSLDNHSVALHLRLGDYLHHSEIFPIATEEYYSNALETLEIERHQQIHLFTDSPKLVKKFLPTLFQDHNIEVIDSQFKLKPVEVMSLMSKYKYLVTSNSTFSSWAGWFSSNKQVITPTPHLKKNWIDRLPSQWIRLPL